jgi:surface protein
MPRAGLRENNLSNLSNLGVVGHYWTSDVDANMSSSDAVGWHFNGGNVNAYTNIRGGGFAVRCFRNAEPALPSVFKPFITTWTLPSNKQITIPTTLAGYDFEIDWGDGTTGKYAVPTTSAPSVTHTYGSAFSSGDVVEIKITGAFPRLYCNNSSNCAPLTSVEQWGDVSWTSFEKAFQGAKNLIINAEDVPNLANVVNMQQMFDGVTVLTGNFSGWDTSRVQNMSYVFRDASGFNQDVSSWDTSSATTMAYLFNGAKSFNQPLSSWNVANVTTMANMFNGAVSFNQTLSGWDTSKVASMSNMFNGASSFNQDLSSWKIS